MPDMTHIAGPPLRIENQVRQRCAWCPTCLIDIDLSIRESTLTPENIQDPFGGLNMFPVGALVKVENGVGESPVMYVTRPINGAVPEDSCAQLPTFLTVDSDSDT